MMNRIQFIIMLTIFNIVSIVFQQKNPNFLNRLIQNQQNLPKQIQAKHLDHVDSIDIIKPNFIDLVDLSLDDEWTRKFRYLLTFHTRQKAFYALLNEINDPIADQNQIDQQNNCNYYQGLLISPDIGYIAATICPNGTQHSNLYATILLDEDAFVIRSSNNAFHDSENYTKNKFILKVNHNSNEHFSDERLFRDESFLKFNLHYLYRFLVKNHSLTVHQRSKRQTGKQSDSLNKVFNIETIIFVDQSLIRRFNGARQELQKLILAIMNEVQLIYNFDTLKTRIRILTKRIVYLDGNQEAPNTANGDIDQYLDNFCAWQKRLWKRAAPNARWDHALMLTGLDLYKQIGYEKNKKVLGLAWVNGMCRPSYSCTLNEGKNFESAFVIAHELAHSLGMLHDGYDNNCDPDKFIMSEKTGPGKIHWSPCSNLYLENFLKKTNLKCLEKTFDESFQSHMYTSPLDGNLDMRLPGEQYTLNQQCQLALGDEYRAYITQRSPFNELWCSHGNWASPAHPALEGSVCGKGKSCYQGVCQNKQQLTAGSKYNSHLNRHQMKDNLQNKEDDDQSSMKQNNAGSNHTSSSFMRKVQRFLRSTFRSIVRFFSG